MICEGPGWKFSDVLCSSGPQDAPFEERHSSVSIAAVVAGSFNYRSSCGTAMLVPGSILLGNHDTCFTCGHEHSTGDRCISIHLAPDLFAEVAAVHAGSSRYRFRSPMLPVMSAFIPSLVEVETLTHLGKAMAGAELAISVGAFVAKADSGATASRQRVSPHDQRRVSKALRHIEEHLTEPVSLDDLACRAGMSRFHFLRVFQRVAGQTPYQYVVSLRLTRAAITLRQTQAPVSEIALDAGFGDLSTFNHRFRNMFGKTPTKFRATT